MAATPYIQFYPSDYLADTQHLTTEEHGAYLLLMLNYYQTQKPLPIKRLANIARCSNTTWNEIEQVLSEFFHVDEHVWSHHRIDADIQATLESSKTKSRAGKKSGEVRRLKAERQRAANKCSTGVHTGVRTEAEQNVKHTDTDTDTDTDTEVSDANASSCPESVKPPPARKREVTKDNSVTVNTIPTASFETKGEVFRVTQDMVDQWQETYPAMDIKTKVQQAKQWCMDNPQKRKTMNGMKRFIGAWLSRAQNRGEANGQNQNTGRHAGQSGNSGGLSAGERVRAAAEQRAFELSRQVGPVVDCDGRDLG